MIFGKRQVTPSGLNDVTRVPPAARSSAVTSHRQSYSERWSGVCPAWGPAAGADSLPSRTTAPCPAAPRPGDRLL